MQKFKGMIVCFHHRRMVAAAQQVQHDRHCTGIYFMAMGTGEELNCTCANEPKVSVTILSFNFHPYH